MTQNLFETWHPFTFSPTDLPENLPNLKRLTVQNELHKERLEKYISNIRYEHLQYLNEHLEIRGIIREFFRQVILERPDDVDIPDFCRRLFGQCKVNFQSKVLRNVYDLEEQRRKKLFPKGTKLFDKSSAGSGSSTSTSSLFVSSSDSHAFSCYCTAKDSSSSCHIDGLFEKNETENEEETSVSSRQIDENVSACSTNFLAQMKCEF